MNDINEIILRNKPARELMSFERLKFLCYFVTGIITEALGFALGFVIVLVMAVVFK